MLAFQTSAFPRAVSIRAPREGGDLRDAEVEAKEKQFQSAPPVKGAITDHAGDENWRTVSIRAPREGGDHCFRSVCVSFESFNPRPP